jgi:hypothetical protein
MRVGRTRVPQMINSIIGVNWVFLQDFKGGDPRRVDLKKILGSRFVDTQDVHKLVIAIHQQK